MLTKEGMLFIPCGFLALLTHGRVGFVCTLSAGLFEALYTGTRDCKKALFESMCLYHASRIQLLLVKAAKAKDKQLISRGINSWNHTFVLMS